MSVNLKKNVLRRVSVLTSKQKKIEKKDSRKKRQNERKKDKKREREKEPFSLVK